MIGDTSMLMRRERDAGERGQVLVIVAVAMTALLAMAGLVIDAGLAWSHRRESQNAADAAAIAGARIVGVDREQAVYDPDEWAANPTFADPGTAIQTAIENAMQYNSSGGQAIDPIAWGTPGAPEYTDVFGDRFDPPLYVGPGAVPGNAQGVYVPVSSTADTLIMQIVGIGEVDIATDATAVTGPTPPVGGLLPLIFRERWLVPPQEPIVGDPTGKTTQEPFKQNCQYVFRDTLPPELECPYLTNNPPFLDPQPPADVYPGNFGWISWDGISLSNAKLVEWSRDPLNAPIDWYTDVCDPIDTDDTCWVPQNAIAADAPHEQFWRFEGTTGNRNATMMEIRDLYTGEIVYVPIWRFDPDEDYNGATAVFEITGFATFRIDETILTGPQKGFVGTYLGSFTGGLVNVNECTLFPSTCPGSEESPFPFAVQLRD